MPLALAGLVALDPRLLPVNITRQLGGTFLTFAAICWLARDAQPGPALDAILEGMALGLAVGFLCSLSFQLSGRVGSMHWTAVATWLLLAIGYASCVPRRRARRARPL